MDKYPENIVAKKNKRMPQLNKHFRHMRANFGPSPFVLACQRQQERLEHAGIDMWDALKLQNVRR